MTNVPPPPDPGEHVCRLLDENIQATRDLTGSWSLELATAQAHAEKTAATLQAFVERLTELEQARAMVDGTPMPLTAAQVQSKLEGLGMRLGPVVLGVDIAAPNSAIEAYADMMRRLNDLALHQVRLANDLLKGRREQAAPSADVCKNCGLQIQRSGADLDGPYVHPVTFLLACDPDDPISAHAEPMPQDMPPWPPKPDSAGNQVRPPAEPAQDGVSPETQARNPRDPAWLRTLLGKAVRVRWVGGGGIEGALTKILRDEHGGDVVGFTVDDGESFYTVAPDDVAAIEPADNGGQAPTGYPMAPAVAGHDEAADQ